MVLRPPQSHMMQTLCMHGMVSNVSQLHRLQQLDVLMRLCASIDIEAFNRP